MSKKWIYVDDNNYETYKAISNIPKKLYNSSVLKFFQNYSSKYRQDFFTTVTINAPFTLFSDNEAKEAASKASVEQNLYNPLSWEWAKAFLLHLSRL